ncbi:MAG: cytochrome c oxidase subunit 3 [Acidimicrobiales bacterium]
MDTVAVDRSPFDAIPAQAVAPTPARPRLLFIGTALASAAVASGFSGLVGLYVAARADLRATGQVWLPRGVEIPLTQPNMMAFTLVFSAVTMYWAVSSIKNDDRNNATIALAMSTLFGFAYIAQTAYLLTIMGMPVRGDELARPPLFYAIIGSHIVIMLAAVLYAVVMWLRTLGGEYSAKDVEGIRGAAMFWYVAVGLYLVFWYAIYITK